MWRGAGEDDEVEVDEVVDVRVHHGRVERGRVTSRLQTLDL